MHDYLNAAKVTLSAPIEDPEDYRGQSLSALACAVIAVAESLARIADALEAMKPQPVTIAEALKRPGVRSGVRERGRRALNHTGGITPESATSGQRNRFTSANSRGVDETTPRARAEDATEPILRPTDQRYEPPAVDDESGCCRV